jgi:hypothetical protein
VSSWETVHAGDTVLGHDGLTYGVLEIVHGDPQGPTVTLTRFGVTVGPAQPPPGTPITVLSTTDMSAEARAFAALAEAGLAPQVIRETINP